MANDKSTQTNENLSFELRRSVANAYAFVKGRESVQSFSSFTFEDALDAQIERIEGKDSDLRPNELHRVEKIKNDIVSAAQKIKSLPSQFFNKADPSTDVNTPPEGSDV
jgi:hypothetical protein